MKLDVDKDTIEYIKTKGKVINIDLYTSKSCWVKIPEPKVNFGKPKLIQQFDEHSIGDVIVYVNRFIESKGDVLTIRLNKFLGIKSIVVSGVKL